MIQITLARFVTLRPNELSITPTNLWLERRFSWILECCRWKWSKYDFSF